VTVEPLLRAEDIAKSFVATRALDGVSLAVLPGEIHALVGENGAGKSTLIRILSGVHRPDRGAIWVAGRLCQFGSPREAIAAGIATIPQELRLVPSLSVAENIALGDLPVRRRFGVLPAIDRGRMRLEARAVLARLDFAPDPDARVGRLSFAERQLVAIGKALRRRCRVLILDEPTGALETREIERLFAVLATMKTAGVAIIYISHRLEEVIAVADRCTVLRDGRVVAVRERGAYDLADLVHAMTGRAGEPAASSAGEAGEVMLEELGIPDGIVLRRGEVLGLAGLLGSGRDRRVRRLFGAAGEAVQLRLKQRIRRLAHPAAAIAEGIGMVPAERALGLIGNQSVRDNILLPGLRGWRLNNAAGDRLVAELMDLLDIRPRRPELKAAALSGGNQQKVIFAKWLALRAGILLLEEPTQGIDVGAKVQIHALIRDFARRRGSVLLSSSDLAELARLCDGVLALRQGRIAGRLDRDGGLEESRLRQAIGG